MSHVRCFAHAAVTAVALVSWVGVGWLLLDAPTANATLRLPFFALLGIAVGSSSLALFPVVLFGYLKRHTDLLTTKTALEAAWNHGCAYGKQEERRKQEITRGAARLHAVETR